MAWSLNNDRRHVDANTRAALAVDYAKMLSSAAKERQTAGAKKLGTLAAFAAKGKATEQAAKVFDVSPDRVERMKIVLKEHGSPELQAAVQAGEISVSKAAAIAKPKKPRRAKELARQLGMATADELPQHQLENGQMVKNTSESRMGAVLRLLADELADQADYKGDEWHDRFRFAIEELTAAWNDRSDIPPHLR